MSCCSFIFGVLFRQEFGLVDRREQAPLQDLIDRLLEREAAQGAGGGGGGAARAADRLTDWTRPLRRAAQREDAPPAGG